MIVESALIQTISINPGYLRAKRILDIVFTMFVLLPLCIVIVIVAILIRLDSKGPIFYRQRRVGWKGVAFDMFKIRSMYEDSDGSIHRIAAEKYIKGEVLNYDPAAGDLSYKLSDQCDSRITRVGRFIRKTSIDELPQFFNVLHGEMTLVGPRPPLPYEVELYTPRDWLRLSGKPGLTGAWQIYGRSRVPFQTMVEMDIEYLQHQSLLQDLKLIALTIPVMIQGRGGV